MKITIYELLGLIKDGKAPKKIKVTGNIYEFDKDYNFYYTKSSDGYFDVALGGLEDEINLIVNAFDEIVEILDDNPKITVEMTEEEYFRYLDKKNEVEEVEDKEYEDIEELKIKNIYKCDDYQQIYINFKDTWNKINALIRNQKYILGVLDELQRDS